VLVHCEAARVFECVPEASPNRTLVRLADELLARGGAKVHALDARGSAEG
jgi:predicted protein tyrosine phosphatase